MKIFLLFESRNDWVEQHIDLINRDVFARFLADEHEVYKISSILKDLNYDVELLDYHKLPINQILSKVQESEQAIYWNLTDGEDYFIGSHLPSFVHLIKQSYIGSSTFVQALCQNKYLLKKIVADHNIKTPKCVLISSKLGFDLKKIETLMPPLFIKPAKYDNSIGSEFISPISRNYNDAKEKIMILLNKGIEDVLIEEAVFGQEVTVACVHTDTWVILPLLQNYEGEYISSYAKEYETGHIRSQSVYEDERLIQLAKKVIHIVGLKDYCRMDFRYDSENIPYLLEVNSGTFLTSISFTNVSKFLFKDQHHMFEQMIFYATQRQNKK